ncbi:MAG: arginine N-succinyltransferase, partial [Planctomycetota bacterium]
GKDTVPAVKLLESMGFRLNGKVDPFDGGPHLDAKTDDVEMVRSAKLVKFSGTIAKSKAKRSGFVSLLTGDGEYRALHTTYAMSGDGKEVALPKDAAKAISVTEGDSVGVTMVKL